MLRESAARKKQIVEELEAHSKCAFENYVKNDGRNEDMKCWIRLTGQLEMLCPKQAALDFDNVGLLVGRKDKEIEKDLSGSRCAG